MGCNEVGYLWEGYDFLAWCLGYLFEGYDFLAWCLGYLFEGYDFLAWCLGYLWEGYDFLAWCLGYLWEGYDFLAWCLGYLFEGYDFLAWCLGYLWEGYDFLAWCLGYLWEGYDFLAWCLGYLFEGYDFLAWCLGYLWEGYDFLAWCPRRVVVFLESHSISLSLASPMLLSLPPLPPQHLQVKGINIPGITNPNYSFYIMDRSRRLMRRVSGHDIANAAAASFLTLVDLRPLTFACVSHLSFFVQYLAERRHLFTSLGVVVTSSN